MTDITIDVSGPGAARAAHYADQAADSAAAAAASERLAAEHLDATAAAALTAPGVYATIAQGLAATADGATFWSSQSGKPTLYRRKGNAATAIGTLAVADGIALSSFGAVSDARTIAGLATTAGSTELTSATDNFGIDDVGRAIVVTGAGAGGAKLISSIVSVQSARSVLMETEASVAVANVAASCGTDASAAFQTALGTLNANLGGTLVIDGYYLVTKPVSRSFVDCRDVRLVGAGGDTGLLIAGPADADMLTIANVPKLLIEGINFAGTPGEYDDARRVLFLDHCELRLTGCGFYGLSNMNVPSAAIVWADTCDLTMEDNDFGGCAMGSGIYNCVVDNKNWAGFSSTRDRFLDYGSFRGVYHSKTPISFCYAWIRLADQFVQASNAVGQSVARVTDSRFDEGHFRAIVIEPTVSTGNRINRVHLDGVQVNNTILEGGSSFFVVRADHVKIERCAIGWSHTPHDGISLTDCGEVVVDSVHVTAGAPFDTTGMADGIFADTVASLTIINSPTVRRMNLTNVGRVSRIENGMGGVVPLTKFGPVDDADFTAPPPAGTLAFDKLANRIYARTQNGWLATPALVPGDTRPVLSNLTPETATLRPTNVLTKTSGGEAWNASANLNATVKGSFRMVATLRGNRGRAGALPASRGIGTPIGQNDLLLGVLLEGGTQLYLTAGDAFLAVFPYRADQLVDLRYNANSGRVTLLINDVQVDDRAAPDSLSAALDHRFGTALNAEGSAIELLSYAAD